jgi:hypothetical protein
MSILPPIIRCAGADAPRTLVSGLLNGARLRAPIAERLRNSTSTDPDFWVLERAPDTLTYTAV